MLPEDAAIFRRLAVELLDAKYRLKLAVLKFFKEDLKKKMLKSILNVFKGPDLKKKFQP